MKGIFLILCLLIGGCIANQTGSGKMEYKYTTICEWSVSGTESQSGDHAALDVDVEPECTLNRNLTVDKDDD